MAMAQRPDRSAPDVAALARGIHDGERAMLARAITLIESKRADHQARRHARWCRSCCRRPARRSASASPARPASASRTTIDTLGTCLTGKGHKVAVLAVDPSSTRTGGSILGDKTRMARLAADANAFIRPSPSSGTLGGVAAKTRETMLLCEAAGYDVVLVETVGIGQSETAVADMTDFFLALMLPGAGDELQGIKKGVVELADMIAVNKADGDNVKRANAAAAEYRAALHILTPRSPNWTPPVVTYSALTGDRHRRAVGSRCSSIARALTRSGELAARRREQQVKWMWSMLEERLFGAAASRDPARHGAQAAEDRGRGRRRPARRRRWRSKQIAAGAGPVTR